MVNQSKRSMTKADMVSALRSRGVRGRLTSMRKGELYELLEQSTPPGHTSAERRHPPEKIHKSSGHKKRKPSAYNLFIGKWMRENKGKSMRDAAAAWKSSQKGSGHGEKHSEDHHGAGRPSAAPDSDTMPSAAHDGSGYGHVHSEHKVGSDSKSAGSHDDVPPGMHRMPDGSLMADDAHPVQEVKRRVAKAVLVPSEHVVRTVRTVQTVRERIMEVTMPPRSHARPSTPAVSASSATSGVVPIAHTLNVAKRKCTNSFKLSNSILTG